MHIVDGEHGHAHSHHTHEHTHEYTHSHEHAHAHGHEQEHTHTHDEQECCCGHEHAHGHDHGHDHGEHCGCCGHDHPANEQEALLAYMLDHNKHHALELLEIAKQLKTSGKDEAAVQIEKAVENFDKGNLYLSLALSLVK